MRIHVSCMSSAVLHVLIIPITGNLHVLWVIKLQVIPRALLIANTCYWKVFLEGVLSHNTPGVMQALADLSLTNTKH